MPTLEETIEVAREAADKNAAPVAMIIKTTGAVKIRRGGKEVIVKGKTPLRYGDKIIVSKGANALVLYDTGKKSTVTKTHTISKSNAKVSRPTAAPEMVFSQKTGQMELVEKDRLPEPRPDVSGFIGREVFDRARVPPGATPQDTLSEIGRTYAPQELGLPLELEAPLQAFKALPAIPVAIYKKLTTGKQDVLGFNLETGMFESKSPLEMGIEHGGGIAIAIGVAGEIFLDPITYTGIGGIKHAFLPAKLMKGLKKTGELKNIIAAGRATQDFNTTFRLVKQTNAYDDFIKAGGKLTVGDKKRMATLSKRVVGKQYTPEALGKMWINEPERFVSAELSFLRKGKRTEKISSARRIISTSNTFKTHGVDVVSLENKLDAIGAVVTKKGVKGLKDETKEALKKATTIDEIAAIVKKDSFAAADAWEATTKLAKVDEDRLAKLTKLVIPESHRSKSAIEVGEQTFDIKTPGTLPIDVWKRALSRNPAEVYKFEKLLALGKKDEAYDILMKLDDVQEFIKTPRIQAKQYKSLYGVAKSKGLTRKHISRFAKEFYDVDDLRNLTFEQAGDLIKTTRAMRVGAKGKAVIPKTKELLPIAEGATTREIGGDIGALGYVRPSERTLTGAGLSDAVFEPLLIASQKETRNTLRLLDEMKGVRDSVKHINHHEEFIADLIEHPDDALKILGGVEDAADAKLLFDASQWHKRLYIDYAVRLGLPPDKIQNSYMPHIIDWVKTGKMKPDIPDELKRILEYIPPGFQTPFRKARKGAPDYKKDAWGAAHAYVIAAERELAYAGTTKAILAKTKYMTPSAGKFVKRYIDNLGGRNILQGFDDAVDTSLKNSVSALTFGKVDVGFKPFKRGVSAIANLVYGGALGLSPGSALKNLTQNLLTAEELGTRWLAAGAAKSLTKEGKKLFDDSGIFMSRFSGDIGAEITGQTGGVGYYANRALWAQFDAAEYANRIVAYNGAREKYLSRAAKLGMPVNHVTRGQADKYAQAVVRRVQFAYGKLYTPLVIQTTPGRAGLQFFTYPINWGEYQFGVAVDAARNIKHVFKGEIPAADLLYSSLREAGETLSEMGVYKMPGEREFYRGFRGGIEAAAKKGDQPFGVLEKLGMGARAVEKPVTWAVIATAATEAGRRAGGFDVGQTLGTDILPFEFDVETGRPKLKLPIPATGGVFPMQEDPITGEPEFGLPPIPQAVGLGAKALHALATGDTELLERYKREGKRLGPLFLPGGRTVKQAADLFATFKKGGLKYRMVGAPHTKPQIGDVPYGEMTTGDMARYALSLRSVESEKKYAEKSRFLIEQPQYDKDKDAFDIAVLRGNLKEAQKYSDQYGWGIPKTEEETAPLWDSQSTKYAGAVTNIVLDNLIYESRPAANRSYNLLMDELENNKIFPEKYIPYGPNRTTATNKLKLLLKEGAALKGAEREHKMDKAKAIGNYLSEWDAEYYTDDKLWDIYDSVIPEE